MLLYEEFTRCKCGAASLRKETITFANYKQINGSITHFSELPGRTEIHFKCAKCNALIYKMKE